jgi:transcriptional regulator with XRE-family HTH domain
MRAARIATWGPVQERCAENLKIRQSQISRWESGQQMPGAYDLARFARACNKTVDELIGPTAAPAIAQQLLLGLEPAAAAVVVDLVELLRNRTRVKKRGQRGRSA